MEKKRDELVGEYYRLKNELNDRFISEKIGEEYKSKQRVKLFESLTGEMKKQTELAKEQKEMIKSLLPVNQPKQLAIQGTQPASTSKIIGEIATEYLNDIPEKELDKSYGLKKIKGEPGKYAFGNRKDLTINNNDLIIPGYDSGKDLEIKGTKGFWELMRKKEPKNYTQKDLKKYVMLADASRVPLRHNKTKKWKIIKNYVNSKGWKIKDGIIYAPAKREEDEYESVDSEEETEGKGINTITIPCDPNELLERMDLLIASKEAGNTGVDKELQEILKTLYKKKIINKEQLKILSNKNG